MGQIWKKSQGNTTPTTFTYNIRGWISSIIVMNKFMENLYYTSNPYDRDIYYNGNIAASNLVGFGKKGNGQTFRSTKSMTYKYDGLNRLTNAEMRNYHDGFDLYFENFTYDKNGNILSLSRGWKDSMEDDLSFTYSGNQMTRVADAGNDMYLSSVPQIPCNIYDNAFSYDENGNQTKDIPRKIGSIAYNSLNLASQITKKNGDYMKIKYGARKETFQ
ncbi:MAG: RHS repeat domain-containing protein [Barnesiella sp.]